jgi:hypothetical protein
LAAAVTTAVPADVATVARKCPSAPATAVTTEVVLSADPGWPIETTTVAPGAVVPLITSRPPLTAAETDIDTAVGGPFLT